MTGFTHIKVSHTGFHNKRQQQKRSTCTDGGFYTSPTAGQTIDVSSNDKYNMTWDSSCLNSTAVDIYLYAPGSSQSLLHVWENVNFMNGNYEASFKPKWWNATSSVTLQLAIVNSGQPAFLASMPAGPIFTATYTKPSDGSTPADADTSTVDATAEEVNNFARPKKGPSKGGIAAAVIFPLLVVALCVAAYIKFTRERGKEKRKRWSEAVDKRMSTISTDWKSISAAGASAAIRNSIAVNRASTYSLGGGQAGVGSKGLYSQENVSLDEDGQPQMSQLRSGVRTSTFGERVSRVSFAADTRPSGEQSRRLIVKVTFHNGFVPPVPQRSDSTMTTDSAPVSPTQKAGPLTLTAEEIQARISGSQTVARPSVDEVLPALSMMTTGNPSEANDYLFSPKAQGAPELPTPPTPTHSKSPIMGVMPMQPMPANVMSPDDMLRAYAESRKAAAGTPSLSMSPVVSVPAFPTPSYNGNGMRTLYSPPGTPITPATGMPLMAQLSGDNNPYRMSMGVSPSERSNTSMEGRHSHEQDTSNEDAYDLGSAH
ncbi:hypothetical protein NEOLEDRAFT_1083690 [Neolentinus lepideus HHB14362 ss-1]|uniref:Uncharacterized protein n=1 Tax=Neolentinus lepideus HHB14362 ss-1 TaxID=1314782 RepID=A0A165VQ36_9AGAM|nr:hypothetical protein NEOLEDRAFT_1083690 [Neolentinus lepideus HHB14362 ss-1]